jgi:predicted alpha/beta hydrolase family esterase
MPDEGGPSYARWSEAIRREMADLDDGAVVVGHSVGATVLVHAPAALRCAGACIPRASGRDRPASHAGLYARAIPHAQVRQLHDPAGNEFCVS